MHFRKNIAPHSNIKVNFDSRLKCLHTLMARYVLLCIQMLLKETLSVKRTSEVLIIPYFWKGWRRESRRLEFEVQPCHYLPGWSLQKQISSNNKCINTIINNNYNRWNGICTMHLYVLSKTAMEGGSVKKYFLNLKIPKGKVEEILSVER